MSIIHPRESSRLRRSVKLVAAAAVGAAALAALNALLARRAERRHPPLGCFVEVDGTRLHYVTRGTGKPLVLLHGNGSMIEDFVASGLLEEAAGKYRVIAFDRPGFGHSPRPRDRVWSPRAQADAIAQALDKIGVEPAVFFAHSWGTLVALALARRAPRKVVCLVLASGYYFPTPRVDVWLASISAVPGLGTLLRHTIQPLLSRILWRSVAKRLFSPAPVSPAFSRFPKSLAVRPSQLRSMGEESAMMIPAAAELSKSYSDLRVPVSLVAGAGDRIVTPTQSRRLHKEMLWSSLSEEGGAGHMVHYSALPAVICAIDTAMAKYG